MFGAEPLSYKSSLEGRLANSETQIIEAERQETQKIIDLIRPVNFADYNKQNVDINADYLNDGLELNKEILSLDECIAIFIRSVN